MLINPFQIAPSCCPPVPRPGTGTMGKVPGVELGMSMLESTRVGSIRPAMVASCANVVELVSVLPGTTELKYVAFSHGIDLSSCRFPSEGYVRLSQPRKTFQRALKVVSATWSGSAKEQAETFLNLMLKGHYDEEQPFDIVRVRDFEEPPWRPEVGKALFQILVNASQTE